MRAKLHLKNLVLFSLFLLFNSCAVLNKYSFDASVIDLSMFEKEGIFVTTGDISKS